MKTLYVVLALLITTTPLCRLQAAEPSRDQVQLSTKTFLIPSPEIEDVDVATLVSRIANKGNVAVFVSNDVAKVKVKHLVLSNVGVEEALRAAANATNVELTELNGIFLLREKGSSSSVVNSAPSVFSGGTFPVAGFPVATKPYKLEFTIGKILTQSIRVQESGTFSIAARVGENTYEFSGTNEVQNSDMLVTIWMTETNSPEKGGGSTSGSRSSMRLQVAERSETPAKAAKIVGQTGANTITVSVSKVK